MIKNIFKLLLCIFVYSVVFLVVAAILPYSQKFKELPASDNSLGILFIFINAAWVCFTIFFIIKNSQLKGVKLYLVSAGVLFLIHTFMTQIETLFFIHVFPGIIITDVILFMLRDLIALALTTVLMVKFFQNKEAVSETEKINIKSILIKLGIIGIIYTFVYMVFGYFVAWQFEELRVFYSGSAEKLSFFGQLANNIKTNPVIYPFQFIRGILFSGAILPLLLSSTKKKIFIISVCFVYFTTATVLLIPNVLFPDMVRYGHLIEMSTSMTVFGLIVGNIMWINKKQRTCT